ncbi:MAG: thioredoxin [Acidimicrobiales bacterium]
MSIDVTDATFEADVLQRSMSTPVVVDLWAPWCGPCKTLGPILEKVIDETDGRVVLAKINVDENPQASQAFQVQSIPAVYALDKGQVVSNFMGAQPEAQVRAFVSELSGGAVGQGEVEQLLAKGDEASLRKALELDPASKPATVLLTQLLLQSGRPDDAVAVLSAFPDEDDDIATMLATARAMALPPDAQNQIDAKLAALLPTVKGDDDARAEFVSLLDELSTGNPEAASDWRRKLSAQLF